MLEKEVLEDMWQAKTVMMSKQRIRGPILGFYRAIKTSKQIEKGADHLCFYMNSILSGVISPFPD